MLHCDDSGLGLLVVLADAQGAEDETEAEHAGDGQLRSVILNGLAVVAQPKDSLLLEPLAAARALAWSAGRCRRCAAVVTGHWRFHRVRELVHVGDLALVGRGSEDEVVVMAACEMSLRMRVMRTFGPFMPLKSASMSAWRTWSAVWPGWCRRRHRDGR